MFYDVFLMSHLLRDNEHTGEYYNQISYNDLYDLSDVITTQYLSTKDNDIEDIWESMEEHISKNKDYLIDIAKGHIE